jgi:hypothetical protein
MSENMEVFNYELGYAWSYFRTEVPIAICEKCGVVNGIFRRESNDGMGGGYGTAEFSHEHPLIFLILEEEDSHLAGPRYCHVDGNPHENIAKILKRAGRLWKSGWGVVAVERWLVQKLGSKNELG